KHSSPAPFEADLARVGFFYALIWHITSFDELRSPLHPAQPILARQPVRLPGHQPAKQGSVDRGEPQSGQGVQLRLHLLLRRSNSSGDDPGGGSGGVAGGIEAHAGAGEERRTVSTIS